MCFSVAPDVTSRQCPTVFNENIDAKLFCNATGNPVPSIKWIRRSTGEVTIVSNSNALVFAAINRNDSGLYQCIANNSVGSYSRNCTVDVHCKLNNYVKLKRYNLMYITFVLETCTIVVTLSLLYILFSCQTTCN